MLKFLRTHRTGFFGAVVMGLVCFTMIGFGINFFAPQGPTETVIQVGDREVSYLEFQNRLNSFRSMMQQRLGENFEQFSAMINFEQQTVDQIIDAAVLDSFVEEMEVAPSTSLVYQRISSIPYFGGVMSESSYRSFLQATGMTGPQLEAATRQEIAVSLFRTTFADLNSPTEPELQQAFRRTNKQLSFHVATFSPQQFEAQVDVSDEAKLKEFFEASVENYREPAKVQYQAAIFRSEDYAKEVAVADEDIAEAYEQMQHAFVVPEKVSFRRIVLKKSTEDETSPMDALMGADAENEQPMSKPSVNAQQRAKAATARERLEAGEPFEAVANELSEDEVTKASGGLVELTEYSVLKEPIRSALYQLEPGEVSSVLEDAEAFYLLSVVEKQEEQVRPLSDVEGEVRKKIQADYAPEYARVAAEDFVSTLDGDVTEEAFAGKAQEKNIPTAGTIQPVQRGQSSGSVPVQVTEAALALEEGDVELVEAQDDSYVVQVIETVPSSIPEFETVRARVVDDYKKAKAAELAKQAAEALLANLHKSTQPQAQFKELAEQASAKVETTPLAVAGTVSTPLLRQPDVAQAAFALTAEQPLLDSVQQFGQDYQLLSFADVQLPPEEEFAAKRDELLEQQRQASGQRMFATLQKLLRAEADVVVEPSILDTNQPDISQL